jgi:hypothetical protein
MLDVRIYLKALIQIICFHNNQYTTKSLANFCVWIVKLDSWYKICEFVQLKFSV